MFDMKKNSVFLKILFIKLFLFVTVSFVACSNDGPLSSESAVGGDSDLTVPETASLNVPKVSYTVDCNPYVENAKLVLDDSVATMPLGDEDSVDMFMNIGLGAGHLVMTDLSVSHSSDTLYVQCNYSTALSSYEKTLAAKKTPLRNCRLHFVVGKELYTDAEDRKFHYVTYSLLRQKLQLDTATSVSYEAKADSIRFNELRRNAVGWDLFADPMAGVPFTVSRELRGDSVAVVIENVWVNCGDLLENVTVRRVNDSILDADLEFSWPSPETEFSCRSDISFVVGKEYYDSKGISLRGEVMEQMGYRNFYPLNEADL